MAESTASRKGPARSVVFARQVRRHREQRGWSQGELARRLADVGHPIGQSRVSAIEAAGPEPRTVSIDQAQAFARVFNLPLEQLLSEDGATTRGVVLRELVYVLELADFSVSRAVEHANTLREMAGRLLDETGIDPADHPPGYPSDDYLRPREIRPVTTPREN